MADAPFDFSKEYTDDQGYSYQFDTPERRAAYTQQSQTGVDALPSDPYAARDLGADYYKSLGYAGPTWNYGSGGEANTSAPTMDKGLSDYLASKGYVYGLGGKGYDRLAGYFDPSGKPMGQFSASTERGDFLKSMIPVGMFLGAGALGLGGGGVPAYAGTGGLPGAGYGTAAGAGELGTAGLGAGTAGGAAGGSPGAAMAAIEATGGITPEIQAALDAAAKFSLTPGEAAATAGTGGALGAGYGTEAGPAAIPPAGPAAAVPTEQIPQSMVDKALKAVTNDPLRAAQVGLTGVGLAKQLGGGSAQSAIMGVGQPVKDVSNQLLQQFRAGQLSGADAFAIQDWQQKQKASIDQYFAQAGLSNSSMHLDAISRMGQQAEGMRQQAIQNLLSGGLRAAGVSDPTLVAGINAGLKQDQASQDAMAKFLATLAAMNTGARAPTPAPAPAPADQTGTPG